MPNESALHLQGQQQEQQEDNREESNTQGQSQTGQAMGDTKRVVNTAKSAFNNAKKTAETARKVAQTAQKAVQAARAAAVLSNPVVIAIIVAIVILLIFLLFFSNASALDDNAIVTPPQQQPTTPGTQPPTTTLPGVTVTLSGPQESPNGSDITYNITVVYDATVAKVPIENIVLYDNIPTGATFVSTDGVQADDSTPTAVTWSLKDPVNQKLFHITLHPSDDSYLINTVGARISGGVAGGASPLEFQTLTRGQARNTTILGDRATFISTIIANSSGLPLAGKESYLGQIYDAAVNPKYNINPLILTVIWGVESSFDTASDYPFGCLSPTDKGFSENVTCAAGSLNSLILTFEMHSIGGSLEIPSTTGNTCIYTDSFDYAYEEYTPVCHASDGNDPARANFINFYKKLKGL